MLKMKSFFTLWNSVPTSAITAEQVAANLPQLLADMLDNPAYAENARLFQKIR
jgi:hypothetical protein